nr:14-3-3-like protein [Ipomoea batatas]
MFDGNIGGVSSGDDTSGVVALPQIEKLSNICDGILKLLNSRLIPSTPTSHSQVFYLKMMKRDYHRNLKSNFSNTNFFFYNSPGIYFDSVSWNIFVVASSLSFSCYCIKF